MKKLIAISVVFALAAGAAFAVDLGGSVIGTVDVIKGASNSDKVESGGTLNQIRISGSGEVADGKFGGYFRLDHGHWSGESIFGNAWWKPIDQFKLILGSNGGDGFYGQEGNTGWMFYQTNTDHGVAMGGDNVWGGSIYGFGIQSRHAFFGGDNGFNALRLEITPLDMLAININLPFFKGGEFVDALKEIIAQVELKLSFGNIALTYEGHTGTFTPGDQGKPAGYAKADSPYGDLYYLDAGVYKPYKPDPLGGLATEPQLYKKTEEEKATDPGLDPGKFFLYVGLSAIENLGIDFGFCYTLPIIDGANIYNSPIGIGLGVKYSAGAFGVKFRTVATFAGDDKAFKFLADVLPSYTLADNLTVFASIGLGLHAPDVGDAVVGWHFNPYLQIGEEWGAKFLVGFKLWSSGGTDPVVNWGLPIALAVSF